MDDGLLTVPVPVKQYHSGTAWLLHRPIVIIDLSADIIAVKISTVGTDKKINDYMFLQKVLLQ